MNAAVKAVARARADRQSRYREIVRAAASGTEVDPDQVVETLDRLNKDEVEFQKDVEIVANRIEADRAMREVEGLVCRAREIAAVEHAAAVEFDRIAAAHGAKMKQLREQKAEIEREISVRRAAHRQAFVVAPCPYPELIEQRDQADRERGAIAGRLDVVRGMASNLREHISFAERAEARNVSTPFLSTAVMDRDMQDYDSRIHDLERQLRDADAECARVAQLLMQP